MAATKRGFIAAAAAAIMATLVGCVSEHNSTFVDVNPRGWSQEARLNIENIDTITMRDISLYIRYRPSRELTELPLRITTTAPNNLAASEEITLYTAQNRSSHWSSTQFMEVQYRMNVVWSQVGEYKVDIEPTTEKKGVELVGIKIKESR